MQRCDTVIIGFVHITSSLELSSRLTASFDCPRTWRPSLGCQLARGKSTLHILERRFNKTTHHPEGVVASPRVMCGTVDSTNTTATDIFSQHRRRFPRHPESVRACMCVRMCVCVLHRVFGRVSTLPRPGSNQFISRAGLGKQIRAEFLKGMKERVRV